MSMFTQFNQVKENDFLELKELNQHDPYELMTKLKFMVQSRILNFDQVYTYLDQEVRKNYNIDYSEPKRRQVIINVNSHCYGRPLLVNEAKNDLDEILNIINELQKLVFYQKQEQHEKVKLINEYKQKVQQYNSKLNRITERLQRVQRKSVENIRSPKKNDEPLLYDTLSHFMEDEIKEVDIVKQSLQKQMEETTTIYACQQITTTNQKQINEDIHAHRRTLVRFAIVALVFIIIAFMLKSLEKNLERDGHQTQN